MNLFKGLMFLEGHFTRPEDIDPDFAPLGNRSAGDRWHSRNPGAGRAADAPRPGLLRQLFLRGRPRRAGHGHEAEEPGEQPPAPRFAAPACGVAGACR